MENRRLRGGGRAHVVPYEGGLKRPGGPRIIGAAMQFWWWRARAPGAAATQETGCRRVLMGGPVGARRLS